VLLERDGELGGHLNLLRRLPTRAAWGVAVSNLEVPLEKAGVDVRLGHDATAESIRSAGADVVVLATGARWQRTGFSQYRPDRDSIPGWEQEHVLDLGTAIRDATEEDGARIGERVLVYDESAGYWPLGLAELLADAGRTVEILSPHLFVGEDALKTMDLQHVLPRLVAKGVRVTAQHDIQSIEGSQVHVYGVWGGEPQVLEVDTVVISTFREPVEHLYLALRDEGFELHRVGDALAPRKLEAVIYEAERLGRAL